METNCLQRSILVCSLPATSNREFILFRRYFLHFLFAFYRKQTIKICRTISEIPSDSWNYENLIGNERHVFHRNSLATIRWISNKWCCRSTHRLFSFSHMSRFGENANCRRRAHTHQLPLARLANGNGDVLSLSSKPGANISRIPYISKELTHTPRQTPLRIPNAYWVFKLIDTLSVYIIHEFTKIKMKKNIIQRDGELEIKATAKTVTPTPITLDLMDRQMSPLVILFGVMYSWDSIVFIFCFRQQISVADSGLRSAHVTGAGSETCIRVTCAQRSSNIRIYIKWGNHK